MTVALRVVDDDILTARAARREETKHNADIFAVAVNAEAKRRLADKLNA